MSHIIKCAVKMEDGEALKTACAHLNLTISAFGTHKLWNRQTMDGYAINFEDWEHPVVIDAQGDPHYDNYGGTWGDQDKLDELAQRYAIEKAKNEMAADGYTDTWEEICEETGEIDLVANDYS